MNSHFLGLKTNEGLLHKLHKAAAHKPSHNEILEQRVSFAYSLVKPSSGITRERVRQVIVEQDGGDTGTAK